MYGCVASRTAGAAKPAAGSISRTSSRPIRSACAAARKGQRAGVDPAAAGFQQEIHARGHPCERLADDVDEPRRHDGIEGAVLQTAAAAHLPATSSSPARAGPRRREPAQHRVILGARGAIGNSYNSRSRPANTSRATNSSSGLKSVATVSGASPLTCRSYARRPAPAPCTSVRPQARERTAPRIDQDGAHRFEGQRVLLVAPRPVAMQVDVVVSQPPAAAAGACRSHLVGGRARHRPRGREARARIAGV